MRYLAMVVIGLGLLAARPAAADLEASALPGWRVLHTGFSYAALVARLDDAIKAGEMGVVSRASASMGAKRALGRRIPGNMVIGIFRPDYAMRMLDASIAAGIEAPLRFYITENADGTATLSYKLPSAVFAPYTGGAGLETLAAELDRVLGAIADQAAGR